MCFFTRDQTQRLRIGPWHADSAVETRGAGLLRLWIKVPELFHGGWAGGPNGPLEPAPSTSSQFFPNLPCAFPLQYSWAPLLAQTVKNPPAMWETWVWSLGWKDPLEKGMAITPVFLPGESQGQRSLVGYSPWSHKELDRAEWLHFPTIIHLLLASVQFSVRDKSPFPP